ncbi:MAG: hypothetical protein K8R68_05860 [Bacteroidales bacterium]|nr:hypothetical protein [Bacteroidales bacterium]
MKPAIYKFFLLLIFVILIFSCTKNPFGDDDITTYGSQITGKVALSDLSSPEGIYIWLETFDIGTYSDINGNFKLNLPPASSQTGGGATGVFKIYFYISNYKVVTAEIFIRKGEVQVGQGDVNDKAELNKTISLDKLLEIQTIISPNSFPVPPPKELPHCYTGWETPITVLIDIRPLSGSVTIKYPNTVQGPLTYVYIKNKNPNLDYLKILTISGGTQSPDMVYDTFCDTCKSWISGFEIYKGLLPKGNYTIIPYFFIHQQAVPQKLLDNLYANTEKPGPDFLNIPIRCKGGSLEITVD